jgi:tetratricopeptide (TPR) repeat protein
MDETFALENAAGRAIAEQLGISTGPGAPPTNIDPLTYELYCRGRYHLFRGTPDHFAQAKNCLEQAIARSPEFALAFDSLAEICWFSGFLGFAPPRQSCAAGIYYAVRALEIDNTLGETHALLGSYRKDLSFDWAEVKREMDRARELSPDSPVVRRRYAVSCLLPQGRVEEAAAELECALESDPQSPLVHIWLAMMLWLARRYEEASQQARILCEIDPQGYLSHFAAGIYYRERRMFDEAIAAHERAVSLSGGSPLMLGWLGLALAQGDRRDEARAVLDRLHQIAQRAYVPPTSFAWIYLGLGDVDEAFVWMDRAIDGRDQMMTPIKTYPFFDPLRSDPRFHRLLERMNLAE